jgi:hypothetical protein
MLTPNSLYKTNITEPEIFKFKKNYRTIYLKDVNQCLTPVILATQEAEIRRITVPSQPWQLVHEALFQNKTNHKKGLVGWLKV